jgi:hypothetical protein
MGTSRAHYLTVVAADERVIVIGFLAFLVLDTAIAMRLNSRSLAAELGR